MRRWKINCKTTKIRKTSLSFPFSSNNDKQERANSERQPGFNMFGSLPSFWHYQLPFLSGLFFIFIFSILYIYIYNIIDVYVYYIDVYVYYIDVYVEQLKLKCSRILHPFKLVEIYLVCIDMRMDLCLSLAFFQSTSTKWNILY